MSTFNTTVALNTAASFTIRDLYFAICSSVPIANKQAVAIKIVDDSIVTHLHAFIGSLAVSAETVKKMLDELGIAITTTGSNTPYATENNALTWLASVIASKDFCNYIRGRIVKIGAITGAFTVIDDAIVKTILLSIVSSVFGSDIDTLGGLKTVDYIFRKLGINDSTAFTGTGTTLGSYTTNHLKDALDFMINDQIPQTAVQTVKDFGEDRKAKIYNDGRYPSLKYFDSAFYTILDGKLSHNYSKIMYLRSLLIFFSTSYALVNDVSISLELKNAWKKNYFKFTKILLVGTANVTIAYNGLSVSSIVSEDPAPSILARMFIGTVVTTTGYSTANEADVITNDKFAEIGYLENYEPSKIMNKIVPKAKETIKSHLYEEHDEFIIDKTFTSYVPNNDVPTILHKFMFISKSKDETLRKQLFDSLKFRVFLAWCSSVFDTKITKHAVQAMTQRYESLADLYKYMDTIRTNAKPFENLIKNTFDFEKLTNAISQYLLHVNDVFPVEFPSGDVVTGGVGLVKADQLNKGFVDKMNQILEAVDQMGKIAENLGIEFKGFKKGMKDEDRNAVINKYVEGFMTDFTGAQLDTSFIPADLDKMLAISESQKGLKSDLEAEKKKMTDFFAVIIPMAKLYIDLKNKHAEIEKYSKNISERTDSEKRMNFVSKKILDLLAEQHEKNKKQDINDTYLITGGKEADKIIDKYYEEKLKGLTGGNVKKSRGLW